MSVEAIVAPTAVLTSAETSSMDKGDGGERRRRKSRKHWTIGSFDDSESGVAFDVALGRDQNDRMNCLRLSFGSRDGRSMGYLLTCVEEKRLALRGFEVASNLRGRGFGAIFLSVWLDLCFRCGGLTTTMKMDKPLISLILHKFGFNPVSTDNMFQLFPQPDAEGNMVLWHEDPQKLRSVFDKRTRKSQGIALAEAVDAKPPQGSRPIFVNTCFAPPAEMEALRHRVHSTLRGNLELLVEERRLVEFMSWNLHRQDGLEKPQEAGASFAIDGLAPASLSGTRLAEIE